MRRFIIVATNCAEQDKLAWEDVGFKLLDDKIELDPEQRPDVVFWRWSQEHRIPEWQIIQGLLPKLFVVISDHEHKIIVPETLIDIYELQLIAGEGICFTIGSRIQGKVEVPDWEAYRSNVRLTQEEQVKAVAGSIYRFLLLDVFRETAEWCGHMSSVVGPA